MARETTTWKPTKLAISGRPAKWCRRCSTVTEARLRVCRGCGRQFVRVKPKLKPKLGTDARVQLDLKHAARMVDEWSAKAARAITTLRKWRARERRLWDRLVEGPPPPRPKRKRKLRAIRLED